MKKIAVYGTLRSGYGNNGYMKNCELIGLGKTEEKYELTASGIPFVNPNKPTSNVVVEVYNVPDEDLPNMDSLEGYNPNNHEGSWYKRTPINVIMNNGEKVKASIYFNNETGSTLIESGDYEDYRKTTS